MIDKDVFKAGITFIVLIVIAAGIGIATGIISSPFRILQKTVDPTHVIQSYEEYERIHEAAVNAARNLNVVYAAARDHEKGLSGSVGGFTYGERTIQERHNLNRWVDEYNAKSRMINRNLWKSSKLPYELDPTEIIAKYCPLCPEAQKQ